jgi:uncharacterized protein YyaL (SSP411 family)
MNAMGRLSAWLLLVVALGAACTPSSGSPSGAPGDPASSGDPNASLADALEGDAALKKRLADALAAKGPDYQPRTRHKNADGSPKFVNRLILESSPYLVQHAHNPVNWFPWGDEAFRLAERLGRPVFLSVGYATCHWCHVMEEESFEDEEIAAYLNEHYLCIKVDREERPDVDAIYMRAVMLLTGRGGWPMSVWLTPRREPFYAGSYVPPRDRGDSKGFLTLLREQRAFFARDPKRLREDAGEIIARIRRDLEPPTPGDVPGADVIVRTVDLAKKRYDPINGGAQGRPKFPANFPVRLLLRHARRAGDGESARMALTTLRAMAAGGIHDHVGGGFHRYSVDERWLVPHFEKMLYDNAELALAYLEGFQWSGDEALGRVARSILDYVVREMVAPEGGFYSASDADSPGPDGRRHEGLYFTWTPSEIEAVLGADRARQLNGVLGVTPGGQLEGRSVLHRPFSASVEGNDASQDAPSASVVDEALALLRSARAKRAPPLTDHTIQVGWNGRMIAALARGARILDEASYARSAARAAAFVLDKLKPRGRLRHSYARGVAGGNAFAEDHAFFAAGLIELFEATQELRWLSAAITSMDDLAKHHRKKEGGYYRNPDDGDRHFVREVEGRDGALPAASSVALWAELKLWTLTGQGRWRDRAHATLRSHAKTLGDKPWWLEHMLLGLDYLVDRPREVALVLPKAPGPKEGVKERARDAGLAELQAVLRRKFVPNAVLVVAEEGSAERQASIPWLADKVARNGRVTAYVCERGSCELPTSDPRVFERQLAKVVPYPTP